MRAGRLEPRGGRHYRGEDRRVIVPDQPWYRAVEDQDWLLTWLPVSTDSLANFCHHVVFYRRRREVFM